MWNFNTKDSIGLKITYPDGERVARSPLVRNSFRFLSSFSQVLSVSLPLFSHLFCGACAAPDCGSLNIFAKSCFALLATCSPSLVRSLPICNFLSFAVFLRVCLFSPPSSIFFYFFLHVCLVYRLRREVVFCLRFTLKFQVIAREGYRCCLLLSVLNHTASLVSL